MLKTYGNCCIGTTLPVSGHRSSWPQMNLTRSSPVAESRYACASRSFRFAFPFSGVQKSVISQSRAAPFKLGLLLLMCEYVTYG